MTTPNVPVPATALGPVSAATVAFRSGGQLLVSAVVKATFLFASEARMTPVTPDPIVTAEVPDPSGRGLRSAGDLAPYLAETDVLLTGHAEVLPSFSAPELRVWLALVRDGAVCVDRWLDLDASARVGATRAHVHIDGAGPLSREWPRRSGLLGDVDPRRVHALIADIPESFDWSYFQAAPAEQRTALLQGDEWLVLGGVYAQRPRLRTQLPEARGVARLYRRGQPAPREATPIPLVADTLLIDVDRRCVSIVWRGHTVVEEAELGALHVVAGVGLPGREIAWADPFAAATPGPAPAPVPLAAAPVAAREKVALKLPLKPENPLAGTFMVPDEEAMKHVGAKVTPFVKAPEPENPLRGTFVVSDEAALKLAVARATPFEKSREPENPLRGTFAVSNEAAMKLAAAPATPFKGATPPSPVKAAPVITRAPAPLRAPGPAAHNPLGETFTVPDDAALKLVGAPATPFDRRAAAPPRAVAEPPGRAVAPGRTDDVMIVIPAVPEPVFALEAASPVPGSLGAEFLAAMEAAGELVTG